MIPQKKENKMKKVNAILISLLLSSQLFSANTKNIGPGHYLKKDGYNSSKELFEALFTKGFNSVNSFFYWCCDCIDYYGFVIGLSYQEMNILLFVILQPLLILIFLILWLVEKNKKN
jgi:hypothetical protein